MDEDGKTVSSVSHKASEASSFAVDKTHKSSCYREVQITHEDGIESSNHLATGCKSHYTDSSSFFEILTVRSPQGIRIVHV